MGAAFVGKICVFVSLLAPPLQNARLLRNIAKEKEKYDRAANAVDRAKAVPKLGRDEYKAAQEALKAGDREAALQFLKAYNDQAIGAHQQLEKAVAHPEKHSNGFRQLQISVRERARELKYLTSRVTFNHREPFEELQKGLDALNQKLILELFPRRPLHQKKKEKKHNIGSPEE